MDSPDPELPRELRDKTALPRRRGANRNHPPTFGPFEQCEPMTAFCSHVPPAPKEVQVESELHVGTHPFVPTGWPEMVWQSAPLPQSPLDVHDLTHQ
jgi:hypothetical protein